ncbi:hypothetical protein NUU61_001926 [Penicillium alfredii]|uniref:O-methyltransferase domain-containing protein n=1 Tax=Penicillium alfredii TaxID=1506179 RepID=A0A9W9KFI1_9EURO|nr:uncharacterized protein NUU61_001926 [Penicillium alfredii]KAJ5104579.1 hypothetical protein NUU61_001926 [Penicillium alfredii]
MSTAKIQSLLASLRELTQQPPEDDKLRTQLSEALSSAQVAVERPLDTVHRISFIPLQLFMTKIAVDLKLFETLVSQGRSMSVQELAQKTGAQDVLLGRILRYLAAFNLVSETGVDQFEATPVTQTLTVPGFAAGIKHHFDIQLPAWVDLPDFLAAGKYQNPSDHKHTAFQRVHHTDQTVFTWFTTQPGYFADFSAWMAAQRKGQRTWLDTFPLERLVKAAHTEAPLFVDVGGSVGHQCVALVKRLPQLVGRVVLEDLAPVIANALLHPRVERLAHDFWTPQPVTGASFYYLRNVLHDYPDDQCIKLLQLQRVAMGADSVLLVDELVRPATGAPRSFVDLDIAMMACLAAQERTREQFEHLFRSAGLYLEEVLPYETELGHSVMVAIPAADSD